LGQHGAQQPEVNRVQGRLSPFDRQVWLRAAGLAPKRHRGSSGVEIDGRDVRAAGATMLAQNDDKRPLRAVLPGATSAQAIAHRD